MTQPALEIDDRSRLTSLLENEAKNPQILPDDIRVAPRFWRKALFDPLGEASRRPGKEFRGRLTEIAWALAGGRGPAPVELGAAVEALHLGSLIVDDIEDGSARRRGGPGTPPARRSTAGAECRKLAVLLAERAARAGRIRADTFARAQSGGGSRSLALPLRSSARPFASRHRAPAIRRQGPGLRNDTPEDRQPVRALGGARSHRGGRACRNGSSARRARARHRCGTPDARRLDGHRVRASCAQGPRGFARGTAELALGLARRAARRRELRAPARPRRSSRAARSSPRSGGRTIPGNSRGRSRTGHPKTGRAIARGVSCALRRIVRLVELERELGRLERFDG